MLPFVPSLLLAVILAILGSGVASVVATPMMVKAKRKGRVRLAAGARRLAPASAQGSPAGGAPAHPAVPLPAGRLDAAALAAAVLGPLALYVSTLPRTVAPEDDSLFLMAGVHLGIPHPPGYPLYTLIVHLFTRWPFADPAFLGHLSSAVLGALACGGVYASARLLRASPVPALTAAWLFGVSEQFWSQAIIAEVYTLNALLFFATYALVLQGARDPRRGWALAVAAVAWGAGLANHWPLMVLATPGLLVALLPVWRDVLPRLPRLLGAALLTAALPYAWMVWLSQQAPLISFYGSIDTWSEFWFYVSREGYGGVDPSPSAGWGDRWSFLEWFVADLVRQTTLPGFALALLGLGVLARARDRAGMAAAGSGLLALLGNSVVLILLLGFDFDMSRIAFFRPYPLIGYGVVALWLAVGMQWLSDRLADWAAALYPRVQPVRALAGLAGWTTALGALAGAALVVQSASASWRANDRSDSDFAERHAEVVFNLLPQDAVLFGYGDYSGPVGYYRYVEERRPDVSIYNLQGLVFANRLFDPDLAEEEKARALDRFVGSTERAVFLFPDSRIRPRGRGFRHHGFLLEVLGAGTSSVQPARDPLGEQYFLELLERRPIDRWEQVERNHHLRYYGQYLGLVVLVGSPFMESLEALFERTRDCYACLMGMATMMLSNGAAAHANRIASWLARAEALHEQALSKEESAMLPFEQGRLSELTGDAATAAARYRRAYALYPHPQSQAADALRRLGLAP